MSGSRRLHPTAFLLILLGAAAPQMFAPSSAVTAQGAVQCGRCHGDREFLAGRATDRAGDERMFVPDSILHGTSHDTLVCASCHSGYDDAYPHQPSASTATCASCHEPEQQDWLASVHSLGDAAPLGESPGCIRCHGVHRVLGPLDRASPTHPLNEAAMCGECHSDPDILAAYFADPADSVARSAVSLYHKTVHGLAISQAGLIVSATCSDCHRPHRVLPSDSMLSSIARDSVPRTCGACHEGVLEQFLSSAHGQAFALGETDEDGHEAPVCNTCHSAHGVAPPDEPWKAGVIEECGACHERVYETYFHTYHGKVTRLGSAIAARCSDCHTAHLNLPADDPSSSVNMVNRVETCAACHGEASANFVAYLPHGDHRDRERYPQLYWTWLAMTSLLVGVFLFFGAHTLLWLIRGTIEGVRGGGGGFAAGSKAGAATARGTAGAAAGARADAGAVAGTGAIPRTGAGADGEAQPDTNGPVDDTPGDRADRDGNGTVRE
ncbi:MAG TPA: cytochrome c3 family protein [Longimicrobiales bacterium]|nr:cytochrome c3 family protein [Longimicrobiales bacterium]